MKPSSPVRNVTFAAALSILGAISPTTTDAMILTEFYNNQPVLGVPQPQVSFQLGTDWTLSLATDQIYSQYTGFLVSNGSYRVLPGTGNNFMFRFDRQMGDTAAYNVTVNLDGYAQGTSNDISLLWGGSAFGVNDVNLGAPTWSADTSNLTQVATYTGAESSFNWSTGSFTIGASDQNAYLVVLTTANTYGYVYAATADFTALGNYWAPGFGGGGGGTWSSGSTNWAAAAGVQGSGIQSPNGALVFGDTAGTVTVSGGVNAAAGLTFSTDGYTVTNSTITLTCANAASNTITTAASVGTTLASQLAGSNGMTKAGAGTLTFGGSAANTLTGTTTVSAGTLQLNKSASTTAIAGNLEVANGATLLISQSEQVANTSAVTLSGGTIRRGGDVSEVFGDLNVSAPSFLDFGAANAAGSLSFGTYTESALLTVQNFLPGNKLQFASGFNSALLPTGGSLSNENFSFSNGFTTGTEGGYFTITAIPEPSTILAALGLAGLMLWPARRCLFHQADGSRKC